MSKKALSFPVVPLPVWRDLLDAAGAFRAARLWERWSDGENFALIDAQERPLFPSVLGAARQVFGLVLYRGASGLRFLLKEVHDLDRLGRDVMFLQDALMLDWGTRKALAPEEWAILAELGYTPKPREKQAWPCFRSHCPGLIPWALDEMEARELTLGLRATLACFELADRQPGFFAPGEEQADLLPTVLMSDALAGPLRSDHVMWRHWQVPAVETPASPLPAAAWLAEMKALPLAKKTEWEFDLFYLTSAVAEEVRPYYPRVGLVADAHTGYIYGMEMADPKKSWGELVLAAWGKALRAAGARPEFISIRREEWGFVLHPLVAALGSTLRLQAELPFISEARESLEEFNRRMP